MWPPCSPDTRSTPRRLRKRAIQAAHAVSSALRSMGWLMKYSSLARFRIAGLQHPVQYLAGRRPRHVVVADKRDRARPLVARDTLATPGDKLGLRCGGTGMQ